jgi:hypothetical protein
LIEGETECGVIAMKLRGLFRGRKRKSGQQEKELSTPESVQVQDLSSKKPIKKTQSVEKWIIRSRGSDGRLRHVDTLRFKPTPKVLSTYGPGEYSLQKSAGGRFSKSEKITIDGTPHKSHSRGLPALDQGSKRPDSFPTAGYHRPSPAAQELSPSITTPPSVPKREKTV